MTDMFFQILFIIVIFLGLFLLVSWFFSCLYTEWQLDAAERARKKQEEELQVVKDQDPDGTEETNFIEETSITVDDIPDKKNKKQIGFNVQLGDATLPSNQVLSSVYSQGNDNKKNKMTNSQKQQQQYQLQQLQQASALKQQFPNLTLQDIQQHQLKQMQQQAIQQRQLEQLEQIKQQYPNLTPADMRQLQKLQAQQQQQQQQQNNMMNNSNNVSINVSNNNSNQHVVDAAIEIPVSVTIEQPTKNVEIVIEPEPQPTKVKQQTEQQKLIDTVQAEIEREIEKEMKQQEVMQTQAAVQQSPTPQQTQNNQATSNAAASIASDEELEVKLLYRERKLEEYEFFKTTFDIIDLSRSEQNEPSESYATQFENAIDEADSRKGKINWKLIPLLHATDHMSAIEEVHVLLDEFLKSKFFKKINRNDKIQVVDQLLRSVLSIITKRLKNPAKTKEHQNDLLWIWNEQKDALEKEKMRIKASKSANQNLAKPKLPPKPPTGSMNV